MTSDEARLVLHAMHSGEADPNDPRTMEALEQAGRDPNLLAWFNQQRTLDEAISEKLQEVRVPEGLAERILAAPKTHPQSRRHRSLLPLALAAALVFLITLGMFLTEKFRQPATEFAAFKVDMAKFLVTFPRLDLATDQWPAILRWLGQEPGLVKAKVPPELQRFPGLGCREVQWRGRTLMLVCFAAEGEIVHLFVIPRNDLPGAPAIAEPMVDRLKGWSTASWAQGEITFLVLTKGDRAFLKRLLTFSMQVFRCRYLRELDPQAVLAVRAFVEAAQTVNGITLLLCAEEYSSIFDQSSQEEQDRTYCHRYTLAACVAKSLQQRFPQEEFTQHSFLLGADPG